MKGVKATRILRSNYILEGDPEALSLVPDYIL